jgi:TetR/AcrR family transcriptional repressor of lmrAB and yxaGH operons
MSREVAIAKLTEVFRQYGFEGATLTRLSKASGLGRASLYHYFPGGKEAMAEAVLNEVNQKFADLVIKPLGEKGKPRDRLVAMSQHIDKYYRSGHNSCMLSIFSLGEAQELFHETIAAAFAAWINAMVEVLAEAGVDRVKAMQRAENVAIQVQGALIVSRATNDNNAFARMIERLPDLLLGE